MWEPLTEREWVGAAVKAARIARGLKQRELVELLQAAGLPWSQGILAKVEVGTRDVSLVELLIVCTCLGTTPSELLYADEVEVEYVELPGGKRWHAHALGELLDGRKLTGSTAAAWSLDSDPSDVVQPEAVLELAAMYLADPDAVELSELTGLELEEVSASVSALARRMRMASGIGKANRKRWTARELVDELLEAAVERERAKGQPVSEYAVRALRVGIVREIAARMSEAATDTTTTAPAGKRGRR